MARSVEEIDAVSAGHSNFHRIDTTAFTRRYKSHLMLHLDTPLHEIETMCPILTAMLCRARAAPFDARGETIDNKPKGILLIRNRLLGLVIAAVGTLAVWRAVSTAIASAGLTGAGSTLVAPLMANWINGFEIKEGIAVKYGSVGSGAGIAQITARTVDFGASDAPLTPRTGRCLQRLRADPLGAVRHRHRLQHPGREETQPHRDRSSPGSTSARSPTGTTRRSRKSTRRLNCRTWRSPRSSAATAPVTPTPSPTTSRRSARPGRAKSATRPRSASPTGVGAKGNSGRHRRSSPATPGAIGYISASYLIAAGLRSPRVKNNAGNYEYPNLKNIENAAATVKSVPASNEINIVNPPKKCEHRVPDLDVHLRDRPSQRPAEGLRSSSSSTTR